jgi:hypothetical protein
LPPQAVGLPRQRVARIGQGKMGVGRVAALTQRTMPTAAPALNKPTWGERFAPLVRAFHVYANWLVSISWKRFLLLSLLLLIASGILQNVPPFSWTISETVETLPPKKVVIAPKPPKPPKTSETPPTKDKPFITIEGPKPGSDEKELVEISIGQHGVRITPRDAPAAASAASAASAA